MIKRICLIIFVATALFALMGCADRGGTPAPAQTPEAWIAPDSSVHQMCVQALPEAASQLQRDHPELTVQASVLDDVHILSVSGVNPRLQPLLIFLHEQGADKEELLEDSVRFAGQGWYCVLMDMPGHGESRSGEWMNGLECIVQAQDSIDTVISYFRLRPETDTDHTVLLGVSMGGSAAYHYAAYGQFPLSALCCFISCADFTRMEDNGGVMNGTDQPSAWDPTDFQTYAAAHNPMQRPERITAVPLFSWCTTQDPVIPVEDAQVLDGLYRSQGQVPNCFVYDESLGHAYSQGAMSHAARFLAELSAVWHMGEVRDE